MTTTSGQPTLEMVAALAGVGRGTASRVINGSSQVSQRSREAVLAAVAELGYVPNPAARSLVTRRTDTVALVISEPEDRLFGEPFFAGIVRGISAAVNDASRQLVLALAQTPEQTARLDGYLTAQHVDGVLLLSLHGEDPLPARLRDRGLPTVLGGRPLADGPGCYVDVDNVGGAVLAVEHLLERGRRQVAAISGPQDMGAGRDRLAGYEAALRAAGVQWQPDLVVRGDFSEDSGVTAMRDLLARRPDVDAVFAANDSMAAGALRVLRDAGRDVPGDVSVVGFDDSPLARHTAPQLTTVHQPTEQMGREMARLLVEQINGAAPAAQPEILPARLVVRAST
jgi:DNA-binding LacI/PurR family transcriptional regulator